MSEKILKALMQLFAIIANFGKSDLESYQKLVESYLKNQLSQEALEEYTKLFDYYYELHQGKKGKKRVSANSVKILKICEDVNAELRHNQKILTLLQLLEFISFGNDVTELELDFVQTVSDTFNVPKDEYENAKAFIFGDYEALPHKENLLAITSEPSTLTEKQLIRQQLDSPIYILHLLSSDMYVLKYTGTQTLRINGHVIKPNWGYIFDRGASVRSPLFAPIYYSDVTSIFLNAEATDKMVFTADAVVFHFKNSTNGLHKFTFSEETGRLIGIMGGSGAGKSTMLNIFNGKYPVNEGRITINGYDLNTEKDKLEGIIGFVPQDDLLIEELTVYQNLYFAAKLIFDGFNEEEINNVVDRVLKDLDLYEIRHLKVGDPLNKYISGGQRKRLNIGLELLREPPIMFVDEPTSGLSSMDSEMVMDLLKELALKGKLIIVNIHQPSSDIYKLFDKILFLDKGGYPIYYGDTLDAISYFKTAVNHVNADVRECPVCGNVNPETILQIIETKVVDEYGKPTRQRKIQPKEWYAQFVEKIQGNIIPDTEKKPLPKLQFKIPNRFKQFQIYMKRDLLSKITNKQYVLLNLLESPVLAVILGYFTKYIAGDEYIFAKNENLAGFIFMAVVVSLFLGMTVSAEEIIKDKKILERESFLNLSRFSYINSKVLLMVAISAIQTISFVIFSNWILGIHGLLFQYWLVLFSTSVFANLIGLNISSGLNSVVTIYILIPFILVPELLLSGTVVKFDKLHKSLASENYVPFVGDLMTSRWAYEALAVSEYKDNLYEKYFYDLDKKMSDYSYIYSSLIPTIENKITSITYNLKNNENKEETQRNYLILKNEIPKLQKFHGKRFPSFTLEDFKDTKFINHLNNYLSKIKIDYSKKRTEISRKKDNRIKNLTKRLGGQENLIKLKNDNFNESMSDIVLNKQELRKTVDVDNEIIRKSDPIFHYPDNRFGRAHLYAPVKRLGNYYIDTFWFNIMFIWVTTIFLYLFLQFDILKKLINMSDNFKLFSSKK
jgi:ABC-type multidrug transport system ATPase subunit/ABC-type multidrug transport system permease subunit